MKNSSNKIILIALVVFSVFFSLAFICGDYATSNVLARNISSECNMSLKDGAGNEKWLGSSKLLDDEYTTYSTFAKNDALIIKSETPIAGLYIVWNKIPGEWTLNVGDSSFFAGKNGFLHEYVDVVALSGKTPNEVSVKMPKDISVCDVYVFSEGELPDWVQVWEPQCEKADIMLLSTHSDDEQLFFAGLLPYYAGEVGAAVQVVYLTNHWDTQNRPHEQINGLWKVGVKNYPVVGYFPDDVDTLKQSGESVQQTLERVLKGYYDETGTWNEANLMKFQVEMIRRFKPQVIVAHDVNGEYQHGAHIANTYTLQQALTPAADSEQYKESANLYGVWDVPKVYIHLWQENKITMNWDVPLEKFGGKTAFEVSKEGYLCHRSQQWTWFTKWLTGTSSGVADTITKASEIKTYSPCEFGLYKTLVGVDTKADLVDNIILYKDQVKPEEKTPEPTQPAGQTPGETTSVPTASVAEITLEPTDDADESNTEDILIYCAMIACVIAIIVMAVLSAKGKNKK